MITFNATNHSSGVLTNVSVYVPPVPFFKMQAKPGVPQIQQNQTVIYQYLITITAPYNDPPNITVHYKFNEIEGNESIKLALSVNKFMVPFPMDQQTFFTRWGSLNSPQLEANASFPPQPTDLATQLPSFITSFFRVSPLPIQLPPNNYCTATVIQFEGGVQGVLARVYPDPQSGRINVQLKGTTPAISSSMQKLLDALFK